MYAAVPVHYARRSFGHVATRKSLGGYSHVGGDSLPPCLTLRAQWHRTSRRGLRYPPAIPRARCGSKSMEPVASWDRSGRGLARRGGSVGSQTSHLPPDLV
eukprot:362746-Pleurochrysis_carterae.AAC.1